MAKKDLINLGTAADSGTGDSARAGGLKINRMFTDIYTAFGDAPLQDDGTREPLGAYEVGELHPAGHWWTVAPGGTNTNIPTGVDWDNTYDFVRGERINLNLANYQSSYTYHMRLPVAVAGDVVRIKDVDGTLGESVVGGATITRTLTFRARLADDSDVDIIYLGQAFNQTNGELEISSSGADLEFVYTNNDDWVLYRKDLQPVPARETDRRDADNAIDTDLPGDHNYVEVYLDQGRTVGVQVLPGDQLAGDPDETEFVKFLTSNTNIDAGEF